IASAMITEFGGAVAVPNAMRSSDSTTTIRVNDVIMIRIEGAIESTVSSAISWIARSVTPPLPWPRLILISCARPGSASDPAAIRLTTNKNTLRGKVADLTKGTLDGPAATPFRPQDSQSRSSAEREPERAPRRARAGPAAVRALPAEPPVRPAGAGRLRAAAPSRRDFGRPPIARAPGQARAAVAAVPPRVRVRAREPAAEAA